MAITNRIKRLLRADVNAILDVIEEPEAVLKQAIREMQESLDRDRGFLTRTQKNLDAMRQGETILNEQLMRIQADLELCLAEGPEELARKAIGRKLSCQRQLETLRRRISGLEQLEEEKKDEIELQQDQLESIIEKAELYVQTKAEGSPFSVAESILSSSEPGIPTGSMHVTEEEIELEWIRLREKGGTS